MIFMAGVGYEEDGQFTCKQFIAETECVDAELKMLTEFVTFLEQRTNGACCDGSQTALYHWTSPEVWQSEKAADTHKLPADHTLRRLPWIDLSKPFSDGVAALPGCLDTTLKHVAKALGKLNHQRSSLAGGVGGGIRRVGNGMEIVYQPQAAGVYGNEKLATVSSGRLQGIVADFEMASHLKPYRPVRGLPFGPRGFAYEVSPESAIISEHAVANSLNHD